MSMRAARMKLATVYGLTAIFPIVRRTQSGRVLLVMLMLMWWIAQLMKASPCHRRNCQYMYPAVCTFLWLPLFRPDASSTPVVLN